METVVLADIIKKNLWFLNSDYYLRNIQFSRTLINRKEKIIHPQ